MPPDGDARFVWLFVNGENEGCYKSEIKTG